MTSAQRKCTKGFYIHIFYANIASINFQLTKELLKLLRFKKEICNQISILSNSYTHQSVVLTSIMCVLFNNF